MTFLLLLISLLVYLALLLWLAIGFRMYPRFKSRRLEPVPLTVIICARNEKWNIPVCLKSLILQDYPDNMVELILVDDNSNDNTVAAAESILTGSGLTYRIIRNRQRLGKKKSIALAMGLAVNQLIVLRDADTYTVSRNWLRSISDYYQFSKADLIIGPVAVSSKRGWLRALQAAENSLLTMMTAGSARYRLPFLCNGANLVFTRSIFTRVGGFSSHEHIESGDDIFLLEDIKKIPGARIAFLNSAEALVETYPERTFKSLIRQRTRWASKFRYNRNTLNAAIAIVTFFVNAIWIACLFCAVIRQDAACALFLALKLSIDILLLFLSAGLGGVGALLPYLPMLLIAYPFYAVMIGIRSLSSKVVWK